MLFFLFIVSTTAKSDPDFLQDIKHTDQINNKGFVTPCVNVIKQTSLHA